MVTACNEALKIKDQELEVKDKQWMKIEKKLINAEESIQALLGSYSWKGTAPLRKIYEVFSTRRDKR